MPQAPRPEGTLTWDDLVADADRRLRAHLGGDRRQEARWLVERVSGYDAAELIAYGDEAVTTRAFGFFDQLVARRSAGEPLQYVLGRWAFRTLDLLVGRGVLIPRPETEVVAGVAIDLARNVRAQSDRSPVVVDLGTGSGAIALSVAAEVPGAEVWATDLSEDALSVARANLAGMGRVAVGVRIVMGDWFCALPPELAGRIDVIVSNPPYVAERERADLAPDVVDWEPEMALFGPGHDGAGHVHALIEQAPRWLSRDGAVVIEMSPSQTVSALDRARDAGFTDVRVVEDLAGRARAVVGRRAPGTL